MSDYDEAAYNVLAADPTLIALATGGIHHDLPINGLSRDAMPSAYDADGFLKPTVVVTGRAIVPGRDLRDPAYKFTIVRQTVEVWMYADRDADWPTTLRDQVYQLLQDEQISGTYPLELTNNLKTRAPELGDARLIKSEYQVVASYGG